MDYKRGGIRLTYQWGGKKEREKLLDSPLFLVYAFTRKETRKKALNFRVPVPFTQNILSKIASRKVELYPDSYPSQDGKYSISRLLSSQNEKIFSSRQNHLQEVLVGNGKLLSFPAIFGRERSFFV